MSERERERESERSKSKIRILTNDVVQTDNSETHEMKRDQMLKRFVADHPRNVSFEDSGR